MQKINVTSLLKELPKISLIEEIPYSILNSLYTKSSQKELEHSKILACFLNPAESHKHRFLFLRQFLKDIDLEEEANNLSNFKNINVYTERSVKVPNKKNPRSIDILITWELEGETNAIIIENKLNYAIDQPDQLKDYYDGIIEENFNVKKVVYMHIDQHIEKNENEVSVDIFKCLINFNSQNLIDSLQECNINNTHSHITEYINLLKNNVQNYMYTETALEIQKKLLNNHESFKNLVAVSKIVNSKEWHAAKFEIILSEFEKDSDAVDDKLIISEVNKSAKFNAYYRSLYFENQKCWLDIWSFDDSVKLYLCCKDEDAENIKKLKIGEVGKELKFEHDSDWESWKYYNIKDEYSCINYPSGLNEFKNIITKILKGLN